MMLQPIYDIPSICRGHGLEKVVVCPGSRCAPLTLAFARNEDITTYTFQDERSAGFIALGMAQQTKKPVAMVSTSGTAAINFYPAIAEAWYQCVPLIVFTADRPEEWIDQQDGQAVRQQKLYGRHVKASLQFPNDLSHSDAQWHANRLVNEALLLATQHPQGPVHINVPIREPFYPKSTADTKPSPHVRVIQAVEVDNNIGTATMQGLCNTLSANAKIMVVAGQGHHQTYSDSIGKFATKCGAVTITEITANLHTCTDAVAHSDHILHQHGNDVALQPDLVITFGQSVLSKKLKQFLRSCPSLAHWHIGIGAPPADTFRHLSKVIQTSPDRFFNQCLAAWPDDKNDSAFQSHWHSLETRALEKLEAFRKQPTLNDLHVVQHITGHLPDNSFLHLANSMSVRYANLFGLVGKAVEVFCNRGTSGIDGCTSTAMGHALASAQPHILITGDIAFFYDQNALWHRYLPENLYIVLLNNHGGMIFDLIEGPGHLPEKNDLFVTQQPQTAKQVANGFGIKYVPIDTMEELTEKLVFKDGPIIFEIETLRSANKVAYQQLLSET